MSVMILVSSCLLGKKCAHDGKARTSIKVIEIAEKYGYVDICPEMAGGLPSPRNMYEISGGGGADVLDKKAKVITPSGEDFSLEFIRGAEETLREARRHGVKIAILKARSPSCGKCRVYSGRFDRSLKNGAGVTAALLIKNGIKIYTDEEWEKASGELSILKKN